MACEFLKRLLSDEVTYSLHGTVKYIRHYSGMRGDHLLLELDDDTIGIRKTGMGNDILDELTQRFDRGEVIQIDGDTVFPYHLWINIWRRQVGNILVNGEERYRFRSSYFDGFWKREKTNFPDISEIEQIGSYVLCDS